MIARSWLLTWTTYGTWLPGDSRGFVGFHVNELGDRVIHNQPKTEYDDGKPRLRNFASSIQREEVCLLTIEHARVIAVQFAETARFRGFDLRAWAIMANHVHLVVTILDDDPEPEALLHVFKSYASRVLNKQFGKRTWWTASGSTRKLPDETATNAAIQYVLNQEYPLLIGDEPRQS